MGLYYPPNLRKKNFLLWVGGGILLGGTYFGLLCRGGALRGRGLFSFLVKILVKIA